MDFLNKIRFTKINKVIEFTKDDMINLYLAE